jgi:hypothetical protein
MINLHGNLVQDTIIEVDGYKSDCHNTFIRKFTELGGIENCARALEYNCNYKSNKIDSEAFIVSNLLGETKTTFAKWGNPTVKLQPGWNHIAYIDKVNIPLEKFTKAKNSDIISGDICDESWFYHAANKQIINMFNFIFIKSWEYPHNSVFNIARDNYIYIISHTSYDVFVTDGIEKRHYKFNSNKFVKGTNTLGAGDWLAALTVQNLMLHSRIGHKISVDNIIDSVVQSHARISSVLKERGRLF